MWDITWVYWSVTVRTILVFRYLLLVRIYLHAIYYKILYLEKVYIQAAWYGDAKPITDGISQ